MKAQHFNHTHFDKARRKDNSNRNLHKFTHSPLALPEHKEAT